MENTDTSANQGRLFPAIVMAAAVVILGMASLACKPKDRSQADNQTDQPAEQQPAEQAHLPIDTTVDLPAEIRPAIPADTIGTKLGQQAPPFDLSRLVYQQTDDGMAPRLSDKTVDLKSFRSATWLTKECSRSPPPRTSTHPTSDPLAASIRGGRLLVAFYLGQ